MKVLLKQATIINSSSPFNGLKKDIFIQDGIIISIADNITEKADTVIDSKDLSVSIGWMDIFSHFCDPGYEHRETLESGAKAAAAGGFTEVMVVPNTNPVVHSKSQIEYIIQKSKDFAVTIHPIGAITKNAEGKELAEMYDMHQSGAKAFSDGINSLQQPGVLLKALQYVLAFEGTVIQLPEDKSISPHGLMNEGIISTQLGLPGKPAIAEELMIARAVTAALRAIPQVRVLHSVSGEVDLIAVAATASVAEMDQVIDRIGALDGVERTTSSIILSTKFER
jgi:dihydroorotase